MPETGEVAQEGPRRGLVRRFPSVWITLALAVALVAVAVPMRQEASRTATDAWIPMRDLTPVEAAALLEEGAKLSRIGRDTVDLVTSAYLVPVDSPETEEKVVRHGRHVWRRTSASWESYSLSYRLDRAPLERELGGKPLAAFLDPAARKTKLSFRSERLVLYAVFEVALLWAVFLLAWLIVRRVRPWTLVAPAFFLLAVGFIAVVLWYAPALFDADFFFQRWVVESLAVYAAFLLMIPLAFVAFLSLLGFLATGAVRLVRRSRLRRSVVIATALTPAGLLILAGLVAYWRAAAVDRRAVESMAGALRFDDAGAVLGEARALYSQVGDGTRLDPGRLPPHLRRFVEATFAAMPVVPKGGAIVLLPVEGDEYLFLWRRPTFTYLDFRKPVSQIGQECVDAMLATRRPDATGLFELLREVATRGAGMSCTGRPVLDAQGRVRALVYVDRMVSLGS